MMEVGVKYCTFSPLIERIHWALTLAKLDERAKPFLALTSVQTNKPQASSYKWQTF